MQGSADDGTTAVDSDGRLYRLLELLLAIDGNRECFDCLSRGPTWTSWSLGLFLCFRCAGLHRGLGVDVSRVKSVGLDRWTPQQVARLVQIGNERGRTIYEPRLPSNFHRPSDLNELRAFIQIKYVHRVYATPGNRDPPIPPADLSVDQLEGIIAEFLEQVSPLSQRQAVLTATASGKTGSSNQRPQLFSNDLVMLASDGEQRSHNVEKIASSRDAVSSESIHSATADRRLLGSDDGAGASRTFNEAGDLFETEPHEEETDVFLPKIEDDYVLIDL